jgi:hypothetical protein
MRMKAKTSPTGYVATVDIDGDEVEFPVVRFDEEGYALHSMVTGRLVRSAEWPGFKHVLPIGVLG